MDYYEDGKDTNTCVSDRTTVISYDTMVMKSWGMKGNTTYHGGVFHIEQNDTLSVKILKKDTLIKLDIKATFFGEFLLH